MSTPSPIDPILQHQGVLVLDGGLATELEKNGYDLNDPLWSARILAADPDAVRDVHTAYLKAGADCIISATYQASIAGFVDAGYSASEARRLIQRAVVLACEARDAFNAPAVRRLRPLIAASIGPYGACLADGSEFRGDYNVSKPVLKGFHEPRWEILAGSPADMFACETIPSIQEAEVLLDLLSQVPDLFAWISFSCRDGEHISDGTPIRECAALFDGNDQVIAVGVNCTAPRYMSSLIEQIRAETTRIAIVVYPNSGEVYDAASKKWEGTGDPFSCGLAAGEWYEQGARLIGGCCRIGPEHIAAMRTALTTKLSSLTAMNGPDPVVSFEIAEFSEEYHNDVIDLVIGIQRDEFGFQVRPDDQPDLLDVGKYYHAGSGNFWIALAGGRLIGTIGLMDIGCGRASLRKMFVRPAYRGSGVARMLLERLLDWAEQHDLTRIYLGTTSDYHAAHRFYEKHGFIRIEENELPDEFPRFDIEDCFYVSK